MRKTGREVVFEPVGKINLKVSVFIKVVMTKGTVNPKLSSIIINPYPKTSSGGVRQHFENTLILFMFFINFSSYFFSNTLRNLQVGK
jgi:hypothetical protein